MTILATEIQQPQYSSMSDGEIVDALNAVSAATRRAVRLAVGLAEGNLDAQFGQLGDAIDNIQVDNAAIAAATLAAMAAEPPPVNVVQWNDNATGAIPATTADVSAATASLATITAMNAAVAPLAKEETAQSIKEKADSLPLDPAGENAILDAISAAVGNGIEANVTKWNGVPVELAPVTVTAPPPVSGGTAIIVSV